MCVTECIGAIPWNIRTITNKKIEIFRRGFNYFLLGFLLYTWPALSLGASFTPPVKATLPPFLVLAFKHAINIARDQ